MTERDSGWGWRALALVSVNALVGVLATTLGPVVWPEVGQDLDSLEFQARYRARGSRPGPPDVVVVILDETSAARMGLPTRLRRWPRRAYADLVTRLRADGASVIAFDIGFFEGGDETEDEAFSVAIGAAGRVLLPRWLEHTRTAEGVAEESQEAIPVLRERALGVAPVPLPSTTMVTGYWSFFRHEGREVPTMPAVALQTYALDDLPRLLETLERAGLPPGTIPLPARFRTPDELPELMLMVRRALRSDPGLGRRAREVVASPGAPADPLRLQALIDLYAGPSSAYLNYYGPPETVCTLTYYDVVTGYGRDRCPLTGRAVFVGGTGTMTGVSRGDTHSTPFRRRSVDLAGVEIQATAFANLLTGQSLRAVGPLAPIGFGVLVMAVTYLGRLTRAPGRGRGPGRRRAVLLAGLVTLAYLEVAHLSFVHANVLLPLVVPVFVQFPLAIGLGLVVGLGRRGETFEGTCLSMDVAGYSRLAAPLSPRALRTMMRPYHDLVRRCLLPTGALVSEPAADGFLAVWRDHRPGTATPPLPSVIALRLAIQRFNEEHPDAPLPTRFGLHTGPVSVEYDADGGPLDILSTAANAAQRIQDLGKQLGGRILASREVVDGGADDLLCRRLGHFDLRGMDHTKTSLYEVRGGKQDATADDRELVRRFEAALKRLEEGASDEARGLFRALGQAYPDDGPTRYYLDALG